MSNFNLSILNHTFGITPLTNAADWWIGLWLLGGDPYVDLLSCEAPVARQSLVTIGLRMYDTNALTNNWHIDWAAVPTNTYSGWFVANGENGVDVGWMGLFPAPITAYDGDSIHIQPGTLYIGLSTTTAVTPGGGGGGGGPG